MHRHMAWAVVAAGLSFAAPAVAAEPSRPAAPNCDRACLRQVLDSYIAAVFRHDPSGAPLAASHKATENAAPLANGQGVWRLATGFGAVQRRYFDPQAGQAAYYGHMKEGAEDTVVSLRIRVVDRRITEAEWTVARKAYTGLFDPAGLAANPPPPEAPLPPAERTSRFHMVALANGYFQALQDHDGEYIPHVDTCERVENGVKVTHRPRRQPAAAAAAAAPRAPAPAAGGAGAPGLAQEEISGDCVAGLEGFRNSIAEATLRRFPLVDEEQGVVLGMTVFRRPATSQMRRNLLTELFFVRSGRLHGIWAAMYYLDPSAPFSSGWEIASAPQ